MPDPSEIFKKCTELDKLISVLRENAKSNSQEISAKLSVLRSNFREILIEYPPFSSSIGKDIHGILWKQGFYKQIDDFRKSIQKTIQIIEGNDDATAIIKKAKMHLLRLSSALFSYLNDSSLFYQDFLKSLESKYLTLECKEEIVRSMHRCLLYLGDLARYKELYSESKFKEYSESVKYYQRAAALTPFSGNPQNQLAVLAIYCKLELDAVYHYCRSLLVYQPFPSAYDNLSVLFGKSLNSRDDSKGMNKIQKFVKKFIHLHAMLFNFTKQSIQMKHDVNSIKSDLLAFSLKITNTDDLQEKSKILEKLTEYTHLRKKSFELVPFNVYYFEEMALFVLQDFDSLINSSHINCKLSNMLLAICLFSVHHSAQSSLVGGSYNKTDLSNSISATDSEIQVNYSCNEFIRKNFLTNPEDIVLRCSRPHEICSPESLSVSLLFNLVTR